MRAREAETEPVFVAAMLATARMCEYAQRVLNTKKSLYGTDWVNVT